MLTWSNAFTRSIYTTVVVNVIINNPRNHLYTLNCVNAVTECCVYNRSVNIPMITLTNEHTFKAMYMQTDRYPQYQYH